MKVAIIGTRGYPSYYGGFETAVRHIAPSLADRGWDVTVYGRDRPGATPPDGDPRIHAVRTGGWERRSLSTLSFGYTSTLAARRLRPDVALVMNVANGYFLPLLRGANIPTVVNVDGIEWERAKWGRLARTVFRTGARLTARWGDRLVFDSERIEERWQSEFGRDGAFIPYGGEPVPEMPVPDGLVPRGYVLVVARFVPENSIPEFFAAVPEIASRHPVVIVGSEGYGGELEHRAADLTHTHENVTWLGHLRDDALLHSLWQHAGLYFHGHSVGGTNPSLVQAMAAGAPILARDTIFNREVLGPGGAFTDSDTIAANVLRLMNQPDARESLSWSARQRASEVYSWEAVCDAYAAELAMAVSARA